MGIIYFIKCKDTGEVYIGSTKTKLQVRINNHKSSFDCRSKQIIKRGNYHYDTLEVVEKDEDILIREQYYINTMKNCINQRKAYQSPEEKKEYEIDYHKQYYEKNKEKFKEQKKEQSKKWHEDNRDKILDYKKKLYEYKSSWGGDPRYHNNLLKININLFHDR